MLKIRETTVIEPTLKTKMVRRRVQTMPKNIILINIFYELSIPTLLNQLSYTL